MNFPQWRQRLVRSLHLHRSKAESKFFQVANVNHRNEVQNRTMVFRGFANNENTITAISDSRAEKVSQWVSKANAQICWYFTKTREQYRISAKVSLLVSQETQLILVKSASETIASTIEEARVSAVYVNEKRRYKAWSKLSDSAKKQFYWPCPKKSVANKESMNDSVTNALPEKTLDTPPNNFVLIDFVPHEVDYLDLKTQPQTRNIETVSDETSIWLLTEVNP